MKKLLFIAAMATIMVSCKNAAKETQVLSATQLADYSEFVKWKEAQEKTATAENSKTNTRVVERVVYKNKPVYTTAATTTVAKKKGWSKAAKGTAIGAGAGAIAGAVINKRNRAVGAVIGGVLGGGVGYGIGRSMDKKDGR
jgi:predicted acetyltransferase